MGRRAREFRGCLLLCGNRAQIKASSCVASWTAQRARYSSIHRENRRGHNWPISNHNGWIPSYPEAIHYSLGIRVDFAQLIKIYDSPTDGEHRYSPPEVVNAIPVPRIGMPASQ